jgi:dTDP-4-dehydrorhamnose reductase
MTLKPNVVLLGASGMIGHQVLNALNKSKLYNVDSYAFKTKLYADTLYSDFRDSREIEQLFMKNIPDFIINCAGVLIEGANKRPLDAILMNSVLPLKLRELCSEHGTKLIHISTDCVFSGSTGSYDENAIPDGTSIYARTKALGESVERNHLTIRTSVIGPQLTESGTELFHWYMAQKGEINGYTKAYWSGVTSIVLAEFILECLVHDYRGLINLTNGVPISKYDLLCTINESLSSRLLITPIDGVKTNKSLLSNRTDVQFVVPDYSKMIKKMIESITSTSDLYGHYNL